MLSAVECYGVEWSGVEWSGVESWHGGYAGCEMGVISRLGRYFDKTISTRRLAFKHKSGSSSGSLTVN